MNGPQPFRERLLDFLRRPGPVASPPHPSLPHSPGGDHRPLAPGPGSGGQAPAAAAATPAELRERFAAALKKVGGEVLDLTGASDPRRLLVELLRSLAGGAGSAAEGTGAARPMAAIDGDPSWETISRRLGGPGAITALVREAGFEVQQVPVRDRESTIDLLSRAALGITVADHAIADTGTVAQFARPFRPRSISLLPPAHLAILPVERMLSGMAELLAAATGELAGSPGYLALITGPSRTADIEKVLTIGIHGPGRLAVVIVG